MSDTEIEETKIIEGTDTYVEKKNLLREEFLYPNMASYVGHAGLVKDRLIEKNMTATLLEKKVSRVQTEEGFFMPGSEYEIRTNVRPVRSLKYNYDFFNGNDVPLLSGLSEGIGSSAPELRISYHNYDRYGNPIYISKDDSTKMIYLWSYKGQYPIAEIKNATYGEVNIIVQSLANIDSLSTKAIPNEDILKSDKLQRALPRALVTTYTYKPLVGMESMTDPRGVTTYYGYDSFNRLKEIYLMENGKKKVVEAYDYNYRNQ